MNVNDIHYLLTFYLKNDFMSCGSKCKYEKVPIIDNFIQYINKKHPNSIIQEKYILSNIISIKSLDVINYCIDNTNCEVFSNAVSKINKKYSAKVYRFLSDGGIYYSNKPFKKYCANLLIEYMINSAYFCIQSYNISYQYDFLETSIISMYLCDEDYNNLRLAFLINQLYLYIDRNKHSYINGILLKIQIYYSIKLHPMLAARIHDLIFKILNKNIYRINMLNIYKILIKFNVLTDDELQLVKKKESKLVMKAL